MTHQWEVGKEYKTRGGYVATILDVNFKGEGRYTIIGKVKAYGREETRMWKSDGLFWNKEIPHKYDLLPPVETKELWVNVYNGYGGIWSEKEIADYKAASDRIGLVKITITGDALEVEKVTI